MKRKSKEKWNLLGYTIGNSDLFVHSFCLGYLFGCFS